MMIRIFAAIIMFCILVPPVASADLGRLEDVLRNRDTYVAIKEARIDSIKRKLNTRLTTEERLKCYESLYSEYLTFRFDSAMVYVDKSEKLLGGGGLYSDRSLIEIHKALSLATSGHFSQSIELLKSIDPGKIDDKKVKEELYSALQWTYGVWAEYSGDTDYAKDYNDQSLVYLDSLLSISDRQSPEYAYHYADYLLRNRDFEAARDKYMKVVREKPQNTRVYAQAAYGLAIACRELGDLAGYREWLINAAISDQITPLKENLALQQLALDIKNRDGDLETANRYLKYSLEDAIFYNNRLRMLEISEKFPEIILAYQDTVTAHNRRLKFYVMCIGVLLLVLAFVIYLVVKEKRQLQLSKHNLSELNGRLNTLNSKLTQATAMRLKFTGLFMDLCAGYIDKFNRFRSTVALKLKVGQLDDLMRIANNNTRPTDAELRDIFMDFDTAFLKLYPDFIDRFNSLLRPDMAILPKKNELLNTDLRIFALIRMGITDSNKIATLLFYSPQTIFNHRTQVRNRAINRETFEQEVMEICALMPE